MIGRIPERRRGKEIENGQGIQIAKLHHDYDIYAQFFVCRAVRSVRVPQQTEIASVAEVNPLTY